MRDLDRQGRMVAGAVVLLLALPFVVSALRALGDGWVPSGDEAIIAIRVHDALGSDPPLTGLPSTSDLYGDKILTNHLGPIEFYVLALPVRLLGPSVGMLAGAGALNFGAVLVALWVVLRRAGPGVAAGAAVLLGATIWSTGNAVLTDPISSNIGGYALVLLAVLAWALVGGDVRLLPLLAVTASFVAQQHLAIVAAAVTVAAWGCVALLGRRLLERRREPTAPDRRRSPWLLGATALLVLAWAPVAVDQFTGDRNLSAVARFAGDDGRPSLGLRSGISQVLRVAGLPPYMARNDLTGEDVSAPLGPAAAAGGVAVLTAMVVLSVAGRRRVPALASLAATALVVALAGMVTGASVPDSLESHRINLYRWTWPLSFCVLLAIGWAAARLLQQRVRPVAASMGAIRATLVARRPPFGAAAVATITAVAAMAVAAVATVGRDDLRRDRAVFALDERLGAAATGAVGDDPVVLVNEGGLASLSAGPAVAARLVDEGTEVQVPVESTNAYGDERTFDPTSATSALLLVSSFGPRPRPPGRMVIETAVTPAAIDPLDRLIATARSGPTRPSPKAASLLERYRPDVAALRGAAIDNIDEHLEVLTSREVLELLRDGYLEFPRFDRAVIDRLLRVLPEQSLVWGDDRVALYELSIDELRVYRPDLFR